MATTAPTSADRPHRAAKRYIYAWGEGTAEGNGGMKDLLGGKGAGLAEMTIAGLPTPPGFTITTEACNDYFAAGEQLPDGLWDDVLEAMREVEQRSGKGFGDAANPLLVSVRSGAKFSMPGMMDTVLNLGLNEATLQGLIALTGNERFGWDAYRRFIAMFGRIVMDVPASRFDEPLEARKEAHGHGAKDTDLTVDDLKALVDEYKQIVQADTGRDFPTDPNEQLDLAIKAVFASWFGKRAKDYRDSQKIAHDLGTAVNVVTMVFGNMGDDSGHRRRLHPRPEHRRARPLRRVPHERPGRGRRGRRPDGAEDRPDGDRHAGRLRRVPADRPAAREPLPRRPGPRVHDRARQALHAPDPLGQADRRGRREDRGRHGRRGHDQQGGGGRPDRDRPRSTSSCGPSSTRRRAKAAQRIAKGLNASPGAAVGKAVFDADVAVEWVGRGEKVVLVRVETSPDDFHGMAVAQGILTARGGATSHAAVVARQIGKPCVAGCAELLVDYGSKSARSTDSGLSFKEGDWISVDGSTGEVFVGAIPTVEARFEDQPELQTILGWADELQPDGASGRTPTSRRRPPRPGATAPAASACAGPSTCSARASGSRSSVARSSSPRSRPGPRPGATAGAELSADEREAVATFDAAMAKLEVLQQGDFEGIFKAMDGLPVVVRLIDPPLHEFLPNLEEQLVKVTRAGDAGRRLGRGQGAARDDPQPPRAEPDARPARLPPRADDPGLREDPDPGDPQRPDRGQEGGRQPDRQDHDPARRPRERAGVHPGASSRPRRPPSARPPAASRSTTSSGR